MISYILFNEHCVWHLFQESAILIIFIFKLHQICYKGIFYKKRLFLTTHKFSASKSTVNLTFAVF